MHLGTLPSAGELGHAHEEWFRLLVEQVTEYAIFVLDPMGHIATWNPGAERLKGYRADEIVGQHFSCFYRPEDRWKCKPELETAMRDGRIVDEGWRVRKDGSIFWANVVITCLRDDGGRIVGFAKVTRDMTERRKAEEERLRLGQVARARMHVLGELSEALVRALSLQDVGHVVTTKGMTFARADTCTLHSPDETGLALQLVAERGYSPHVLPHIARITRESDNPVYAIGLGDAPAIWIENPQEYQRHFPALAGLRVEGARASAFWCVPLVAEGRTIGILGMGFFQPRSFSEDEREFIQTFAKQCAQAVARARRLAAERASAALAGRLRRSLSTTVRSIADAVIATDACGVVTLMNGVAESLTGWAERDGRGRPLVDVFRVAKETEPAAGTTEGTVLIARDGRRIAIEESSAPIRADGGEVEGAVLVFRDVSLRKREETNRALLSDAAMVLSESLDYEVTVARVAQLAVPRLADWCVVDLVTAPGSGPKRLAMAHEDPAKLELAKRLEAHYPQAPDARSGAPHVLRTGRAELYPLISDEQLSASAVDAEHLRMLRELQPRSAMVIPLVSRRQVMGAITLVFAESGRTYTEDDLRFGDELARRCANAIENARLYASEQQARRAADLANTAKDQFLAVVSHELRTPLNAILGWTKLLAERDFEAHRRQRAFDTIERNAVAMGQLIEDLLDMSRVISGKMRLEVQQVDLVRVVEAAIQSIQPAAVAKEIELRQVVHASVPPLVGDPIRLQQIVWNLLSNAVKFTNKGGRVTVDLRATAAAIEVSVTDTGKGIAPSFLPQVFDAFRQEDASPSRSRGGLGLGLAITRQLVELHGGRIEARSEGEGRGATFSVTLPVASKLPAASSEAPSNGPVTHNGFENPAHLRGLRVLVVDDDDDARELVSTILRACGCEVTTASSAREAMQVLSKGNTQVLLSDVAMPGEDGFELIKQVRALPREQGGDIPAAALTAFARPEDRRRLLNAGFSIHLPKPIDPAEVVAVVATLGRFVRHAE